MRIAMLIGIGLSMLSSASMAAESKTTYELVLAGKKCAERDNQQLDCDYKAGTGLWISIAGIGLPDTAVAFMRSSFDGDFYGTYGIAHGCIIIKRGKKNKSSALEGPGSPIDFAFISPRNGKVYRNWTECQTGM